MRNAFMTGSARIALGLALAIAAPGTVFAADDTGLPGDIVVTATKRSEAISQIGAPISAISGDQLADMNANSLSDYITRMPGVVFNDYQPGVSEVVIRGISATTYHEQGQTTVGYYMNEISIVEPGWPIGIPDVDTFDLDRVEVLRGPQGTLFGSSTLGGLVNYVTKTADPTKFDAAGELLLGSTHHSDGDINYAVKGMVNVPIIKDKLAVRVMGVQRWDAGYIDNTGLPLTDKATNSFRTRGVRGSIVWTPAPGTKVTYLGAWQDTQLDDQTYISYDHTYERVTARREPQQTSFFLNSLRLDQDLADFATLTVLGSVDQKTNHTTFSYPYAYVTGVTTGQDAAYSPGYANANIKTIEARLASKGDGPLRWLIGTSYLRAKKYSLDQIFQNGAEAIAGSALAPNDRIYAYQSDTINEDFGVFGEMTVKPVTWFELTGGGRYFKTRAAGDVNNMASWSSGSTTDLTGHVDQREDGFTPKVSVTLRPAQHTLFYGTWSKGYRVGGITPNAGLLSEIPASYGSDRVTNLEAGLKTQAFDNLLSLDLSVFKMLWKNIQAREFGPAPSYYSYVVNAASAESKGVEASIGLHSGGFSANSAITYQDAKLTSFLPYAFTAGGGYAAGSVLPGSSKWSVANSVRYEVRSSPAHPSFEIAHRYLSKAPVAFGSDSMRGGFNIFDARIGFDIDPHVHALLFMNNVFNEYGILNGPFTSQSTPAYSIVRPRSWGLRIDWQL